MDVVDELGYAEIKMTDHDMRAQLHKLIEDIDAGRLTLPSRRSPLRPVGSTVLVAALGLGLAGCGASKPNTTSPAPTTTDTTTASPPDRNIDPGADAEYMAPDPGPDIDPGADAEYMAPDPDPVELAPRPLYAVEID